MPALDVEALLASLPIELPRPQPNAATIIADPPTTERAREALKKLKGAELEYNVWRDCVWGARAAGVPFEEVEQWSATLPRDRNDGHIDEVWPRAKGAIHPGTLFHHAGMTRDPREIFKHNVGVTVPGAPVPRLPAPQPSRFTPVDAWAFADGPDPKWRVDGLLPEQGIAMIYGASGTGKSFLTIDLVMAIVRGVPYGNAQHAVNAGDVVYVVAEGVGGFRKRLRAYRALHNLAADCPAPRLVPATPNLMSSSDVAELGAAIGAADVIVIDTLHASSAGADENKAQDMGVLLGHCRELQAATGGLVLLVHHSGKDETRGARGSSAIRAAMDTEIEVVRGEAFSTATVTKQRDGDDGASICFRLVPVNLPPLDRPASSAAVAHLAAPEKLAKRRKGRTSDDQALVVRVATQLLASTYPEGVQRETLVAAIQSERPDKDRPDNLKRTIERTIDAGLLTIDREDRIRASLR